MTEQFVLNREIHAAILVEARAHPNPCRLRSEIQNVDVSAEPYVVGEVVAVVVGIFVDHDVVTIPKPVVAESDVEGRDAEIESAEPETTRAAACEVPAVLRAEATSKVSMLPGMIEVVVGIAAACVVADPFSVGVNVRSIRMTGLIVEVPGLWCGMRRSHRRGTVSGDVSTAADVVMLCKRWKCEQQADCE